MSYTFHMLKEEKKEVLKLNNPSFHIQKLEKERKLNPK